MANKNDDTIIVHKDNVTYGDAQGDANGAAAVAKVDKEEAKAEAGNGYTITPTGHEYLQQQKDNSPPSS